MMTFTEYPSGAIMACYRHGEGAVIAINRDYDVSAQERADRARKEVESIIAKLSSGDIE